MMQVTSPPDAKLDMTMEELKDIRQQALDNIARQILQISDLVEENTGELSDEFMKLAKCSRQQVDDIVTARDLLRGGDMAYKILTKTLGVSADFHQNINKIIFSMQFQDRARQLMQAIAVTLDILNGLADRMENDRVAGVAAGKPEISQKTRDILGRIIENSGHRELDRKYVLGMFLGMGEGKEEKETYQSSGATDIEFF